MLLLHGIWSNVKDFMQKLFLKSTYFTPKHVPYKGYVLWNILLQYSQA